MMRRRNIALVWTTLLLAPACDGTEPPRDPPQPATVTVTPATATMAALDDTVQLTAQIRDQYGETMAGVSVAWSSSNTQVASVDAAGLVAAVGNGAATITAKAGTATGTADVTVEQVLSAISVSAAADSMVHGDTLRFTAEGTDANGHAMAGIEFTWASDDTTVATVDTGGLATGAGPGNTAITATTAGLAGEADLRVVPRMPSVVTLSPDSLVFTALRDTVRIAAEVRDQIGKVMSGFPVAWATADTAVAVVDSAGLVTAVSDGASTITATADTVTGKADVSVARVVSTISVSPAADSLLPGDTLRLVATALDANGHAMPGIDFEWSSTDDSAAVVDNSGLVKGLAEGVVTIVAATGGVEGHARITVVHPDRATLIAIYNTTGGPNWNHSDNWLSDAPLRDWWGVSVGSTGRVTGLNLGHNRLEGPVPPALGKLRHLEHLWLGGNPLTAPFPDEFRDLDNLKLLSFGSTSFVGTLPAALWDLASLEHLSMGNNPGLTGSIPPEIGQLATLKKLYLGRNNLTGPIPPEMATLANLELLVLHYNSLTGPIPPELGNLDNLIELDLWFNRLTGTIPPALGRLANLKLLWLSNNALTGPIPPELGNLEHLEYLYVSNNRLVGSIPPTIGNLSNLIDLSFNGNALTGPIPPEIGNLGNLEELLLVDNRLSGSIPPTIGNLSNLEEIALYFNALTGPIPPELGNLRNLEYLGLGSNNLTGTIPPILGNLSNLMDLTLSGNALTGQLPPELADLSNLKALQLNHNHLTGPIPPGLGNLTHLQLLDLSENELTSPIPPEFGDLANLRSLRLWGNELTGPLPPVLERLTKLVEIHLEGNRLTGTIPPELGNLENLASLRINSNDLTGSLPTELGALANLRELALYNNARLSGPLPSSFTSLRHLYSLLAHGTELCAPANSAFQAWMVRILQLRVAACGADNVRVYLTQATQSRVYPVPLAADREALLRVFVTARKKTSEGIPKVIARFYRDDKETYKVTIPGKSTPIPTEVDESSLSKSSNATIPDSIVQPDLETVIEIDPDNTLDDSLGVPKRIPETGRLPISVLALPSFDLTMVPFLYSEDPDSSIIDLADDMADDPEGHEMLDFTRMLLPIGGFEVSAHDPVETSTNNVFNLLSETKALRTLEGADGHYKGTMAGRVTGGALGVAEWNGKVSFSIPVDYVMAHELGHNVGLLHAPCGRPGFVDHDFPQKDGSIGAWGYDQRGDTLVKPKTRDLMSYCNPRWISEYHFSYMIRRRAAAKRARDRGTGAHSRESLLLWGGVNGDGAPFLEPAVVVNAPPTLVAEDGDYQLTATAIGGDTLLSFPFAMQEVVDGGGGKLFALAVPAQPEWAGNLATITLSGPEGEATLDAESDRSVVIWRDSRTGQVRGILRDLLPEAVVRTRAALLARDPGLEVFVSRGIPDAAAWRR